MGAIRIGTTTRELPPHTRRRDSAVVDRVDHEGITSAYAEKSESELGEDWLGRNYLRIRGEEDVFAGQAARHGELPPHTRRRAPGFLLALG